MLQHDYRCHYSYILCRNDNLTRQLYELTQKQQHRQNHDHLSKITMLQFFYPPQPSRIWPESNIFKRLSRSSQWDAEIKYNGWRILLFKLKNKLLIYNRHNSIIDIDHKIFMPHFVDVPNDTIFDGELVHFRTTDLKNIMVFWDTPFYNGSDLRKQPLSNRRSYLSHFATAPETLQLKNAAQIFKVQQFSNGAELYDSIIKRNNKLEEGIIYKQILSIYESHIKRGIDVTTWLKCRKISDSSKVTA